MASPEEIMENESAMLKYIPQRPPMVMVGRLLSVAGKSTTTSFHIDNDNIFCEKGIFREPGLIENMAQTAAAGEGYRAVMDGKLPRPGYIGAVKNLRINNLPEAGDDITTEAVITYEVMNATVIYGKIIHNEEVVAECEMKVFF